MTVTYTAEVRKCGPFGCFWKLLARWRGSIYKLIWFDLIIFLSSFYTMAILYRYGLSASGMRGFETLVEYCRRYHNLIPLSFVLGFYVSIILVRWWDQYIAVPWPDPLAVYVSSLVRGLDEHGRLMRRTIMRYVCLSLVMVLTLVSPGMKRRFPNYDHLVDAGLMNKNEANIITAMDEKFPNHYKYWMPIMWAASIMTRARKEGRIWDDFSLKSMIDELNKFRAGCILLSHYHVISVPLVYTQVVTLAVYTYFGAAIFGHQYIYKESKENIAINYYFPIFSMLEFFFFMGWLKVAESLIVPFGDDDDDFELHWVIDRNLQVSYLIVDEMHNDHPILLKDQYWDEAFPELPYADESKRQAPPKTSTAKLDIVLKKSSFTRKLSTMSRSITSREHDFTNFSEEDGDGWDDLDQDFHIKFASLSYDIWRDSFYTLSQFEVPKNLDSAHDEEEEEASHSTSGMDDFDRLKEERQNQRLARKIERAAITYDIIKSELNPAEPTSQPPSYSSTSSSSQKSDNTKATQTYKSYTREKQNK